MRIMFRADSAWDAAPDAVGVHVCSYEISVNPEADSVYLSLEGADRAALFRLVRAGDTVLREPVPGGTHEDNARWWFGEDLGDGEYQAIVEDTRGRRMVAYVSVDRHGRIWFVDDDPRENVEALFFDVDVGAYPDFDALIAALPTTLPDGDMTAEEVP